MAVPEVNEKLLRELEAMGFPSARATRALQGSGNASIEAAIDWIIDHGNDPDVDEMPRVSIDLDVRSPEPCFVTEEMKKKARQLRDCARNNRPEEKNSPREREKERIRAGKELLEAERIAEEIERRRFFSDLNVVTLSFTLSHFLSRYNFFRLICYQLLGVTESRERGGKEGERKSPSETEER
ncbi:hypothetical protein CDL15_Pgr005294 [Punica granatum]|uniref:UBA domain-containing protein n=1 Tax=Punica granatum TaxID=22663 RepID=A0A218XD76_PUNGR|nr:hypothetical protein CDL15_Pgr005294 [Punica granatum]